MTLPPPLLALLGSLRAAVRRTTVSDLSVMSLVITPADRRLRASLGPAVTGFAILPSVRAASS
jgi:hypothetical protein